MYFTTFSFSACKEHMTLRYKCNNGLLKMEKDLHLATIMMIESSEHIGEKQIQYVESIQLLDGENHRYKLLSAVWSRSYRLYLFSSGIENSYKLSYELIKITNQAHQFL